MRSTVVRERHKRDGAWLRRARVRYAKVIRLTIDEEPERLTEFAKKMQARGLYSASSDVRGIRYSILSKFHRQDCPAPRDSFSWHRWTDREGWLPYQWLHETDPRAVRVRLRSA